MLLRITGFAELDGRKLMDVYAESNFDNTDYFFPELSDKAEALRRVEDGFLAFLQYEFFPRAGNVCWVLEEDGVWLSACRTSRIREELYYLEALETRPDRRKRGCAARLLRAVTDELGREGPFRLCDCVSKRNAASLRTHLRFGFAIASEEGFDYLRQEADPGDYGLEFRYAGDPANP